MKPDEYYCMEVLKNTGIVIVPGRFYLIMLVVLNKKRVLIILE